MYTQLGPVFVYVCVSDVAHVHVFRTYAGCHSCIGLFDSVHILLPELATVEFNIIQS